MNTITVVNYVQEKAKKYLEAKPHTRNGLSKASSCCGKQGLNLIDPRPFQAHGKTAPGTSFHKWLQEEILPSGTILEDEYGDPLYEIIGHEQYVYYWDGYKLRKSPIDTVVYNIPSKELEFWDWKSTRTNVKYIYKLPLVYKGQINFYAHLEVKAWNLKYLPMCRVIYGEKIDWLSFREHSFRYIPEMGKWTESNIQKVYDIKNNLEKEVLRWEELVVSALNDWTKTKKPYRYECKYCDHREKCLSYLGYAYTKENEEMLIYGGIPKRKT